MAVTFNATQYQSQLDAVNAKLQEIKNAEDLYDAEQAKVASARAEAKAATKLLLSKKDGVDKRSMNKENRETRTVSLRESGILQADEYIEKVRIPRTKNRERVPV